jgi:hypothetical protein
MYLHCVFARALLAAALWQLPPHFIEPVHNISVIANSACSSKHKIKMSDYSEAARDGVLLI